MILPYRFFIMPRIIFLLMRKGAVRLTFSTRSQSSSASRMDSWSLVSPALLTRISMRPLMASADLVSSSMALESARSAAIAWHRSPSCLARVSRACLSVAVMIVVAPALWSRSAIALPMPRVAPVMRAVLSLRSNMMLSYLLGLVFGNSEYDSV